MPSLQAEKSCSEHLENLEKEKESTVYLLEAILQQILEKEESALARELANNTQTDGRRSASGPSVSRRHVVLQTQNLAAVRAGVCSKCGKEFENRSSLSKGNVIAKPPTA